jgi:two-component system sensor kinase
MDALEKVKTFIPDLIITDILMPNMDGHELVRQLRGKPQTSRTPIIIYTALYLARTAHTFAQTYGVSNILTKPSKPEMIVKAVETALGSPFLELDPLVAANRRLEAIMELGEQLSTEKDPLHLLANFCEQARKIVGAKCSLIGIQNESQPGLQHFFASGIEVWVARERLLPIAQELLNRVLSGRASLRECRFDSSPRTANIPAPEDQSDSLLGVPIATSSRIYGWVCLVDKLGLKEFGDDDERLTNALAGQCAIAYENLARQAELQAQREQLEQEILERQRAQEALKELQARPPAPLPVPPAPLPVPPPMPMPVEAASDQSAAMLHKRIAQLQAAARDHEAFSRFVANDLRTPLQVLVNNARALMESYIDKLDAEGSHALYVIFNTTTQIERLIVDLLALSQTGRRELERTTIDLEILARAVVAELRQLEPARNLNVKIQQLPPVNGDYSMVRQILTNLIANAFKFTRVSPNPMIEIGYRHDGQENIYYIKDNGVGFDMQQANKLFNIFQRLHRPEDFEGNGLGLVTARRAIERHHGHVWAESQIDAGATFYFTIPKEQNNGR